MRLSISAKIFVGFLVVLATFGGVATYGAVTMRRLGDELKLVSRGYELQRQVSELQTSHSNLLKVLVELANKAETGQRIPRFIKFAIDDARRSRLKQQLPRALAELSTLEALHPLTEERHILDRLATAFHANEELYDEAYGSIGDAAPATADPTAVRAAAERLLRREKEIKRDLNNLAGELSRRAQQAALRLEGQEYRAVWATFVLVVVAMGVGLLVMAMAGRTLRPLQRLAEGAKEIARGDYRQRVDGSAPDEIGALGREFNAMAAALDEREQALIRSERLAAVGKIAAQITHEVRNPLSSIGLNAEMLEEELSGLGCGAPLDEPKALARAIVKEVDRLTEITEEYLRFARLPRPRLEREELQEIVSSLLGFLRGELQARGVEVEAALGATRHLVAADEHQLRQALLNLLRNAAEAMPRGGRLRVAVTEEPSGQAALVITDTGEGIAPEHLGKVFDPFFSTKDGGTGLGLALTHQIVTEHGGAITVESEPGRGTTFTVRLPILPANVGPEAIADA
jgi:signal transduction histidine kinase